MKMNISTVVLAASAALSATTVAYADTISISGGAGYLGTGISAPPIVDVFARTVAVGNVTSISEKTQLYSGNDFDVWGSASAGTGILKVSAMADVGPRAVGTFTESMNAMSRASYRDSIRFRSAVPNRGAFGYMAISYYVPYDLETPTSLGTSFGSVSSSKVVEGVVRGIFKQYTSNFSSTIGIGISSSYEESPDAWKAGITKSYVAALSNSVLYGNIPSNNIITFMVPVIYGNDYVIDVNMTANVNVVRSGLVGDYSESLNLVAPGGLAFADASRSLYFESAAMLDADGNDLHMDLSLLESSIGMDYSRSLVPVPEPHSLAMLISGMVVIATWIGRSGRPKRGNLPLCAPA